MTSKVEFICECGEKLEAHFAGHLYNVAAIGCEHCRRIWTVSRPTIEERTNLSSNEEAFRHGEVPADAIR